MRNTTATIITCQSCGSRFQRANARGRTPIRCMTCRDANGTPHRQLVSDAIKAGEQLRDAVVMSGGAMDQLRAVWNDENRAGLYDDDARTPVRDARDRLMTALDDHLSATQELAKYEARK